MKHYLDDVYIRRTTLSYFIEAEGINLKVNSDGKVSENQLEDIVVKFSLVLQGIMENNPIEKIEKFRGYEEHYLASKKDGYTLSMKDGSIKLFEKD